MADLKLYIWDNNVDGDTYYPDSAVVLADSADQAVRLLKERGKGKARMEDVREMAITKAGVVCVIDGGD